jgi:lipopolysaccharide export system protein LptA
VSLRIAAVLLLTLLGGESASAQQGTPGRGRESGTPPAPGRPAGPLAAPSRAPVTVDADRLEAMRKEGLVIFTGNVVATQEGSTQHADRMEVYFDDTGDRIVRIVSTGRVRIVTRDCRTGTANRAEYYDEEQRILLIGNARVWQEDNVVTGDRITIYVAEDRSIVEGGQRERVKAVFHRRSDEAASANRPAPGAPCT